MSLSDKERIEEVKQKALEELLKTRDELLVKSGSTMFTDNLSRAFSNLSTVDGLIGRSIYLQEYLYRKDIKVLIYKNWFDVLGYYFGDELFVTNKGLEYTYLWITQNGEFPRLEKVTSDILSKRWDTRDRKLVERVAKLSPAQVTQKLHKTISK